MSLDVTRAHSGLQVFQKQLSVLETALLRTGCKTRDSVNLVELSDALQVQLNEGLTDTELQIRSK